MFGKSWVGIGREDRWRGPGDYSAIDIMGVPVVVVRGRSGRLRAFANSCRHRGAKLLSENGNCNAIRCPFHRWTYALDGRLLTAPRMDSTPNFDKSEYGLIPLRIDTLAGFVFVCLDQEVESLQEWFGDFDKLHSPWPLKELVSTRRIEFEVGCNWKVFLEVFNEYYHLPYVHPDSLGDLYDTPEDPETVSGNYVTQFGETKGTGALLADEQDHALPPIENLSGKAARGTRYTWMFPNLTFAAGKESIWVYEAYPLSPARTRVGMTVCFPQSTVEQPEFQQHAEHYYRRMDAALAEDIVALENQQEGLSSPFARQGRFSALEPSVATFACWYAGRMTGKL